MARDALRARGEVTLWCLGNPRARSCPRYFLLAKMCFLIFGFRMNQRGTRADQSAPESGHQLAGTHHDRPRTHGFSALSCVLLSIDSTHFPTRSLHLFSLWRLSLFTLDLGCNYTTHNISASSEYRSQTHASNRVWRTASASGIDCAFGLRGDTGRPTQSRAWIEL